ncbi:hypothetical protein HDV05_002614 [Chytridiales sp. JEL 0842]|nr:hypothetical protein HDV05_002614 [Chytridiales sp. JEL 0842]
MTNKSELDTLLETHAAEISALESRLKDVLTPETDKIWLLRYIMSYKTASQEAEEACRFSIKWLHDNKEEIESIYAGNKPPLADKITQFQVVGSHKFTKAGEPVFYVRIGLCNTKGLMDAVPYNDVLHFMVINRIAIMRYCDLQSRKEGRIIRAITVLDFQGFSMSRGNDSRFTRIIGASSKLAEQLFPQLLGVSVFVNVPSYMRWGFKALTPLMSPRAVAKMRFCPGNVHTNKPFSACPYLSKTFDENDIPTFLGGKCSCPNGCVGGVPNTQTFAIDEIDENGLMSLTVSARHVQTVDMPLTKGMKVHYQLKIKERKIEVFAHLKGTDGSEHKFIEKKYLAAEDGTLSGDFVAPVDGNVDFVFDNSHSLLRSKHVSYKLEFSQT